jgi:hypothetical protein
MIAVELITMNSTQATTTHAKKPSTASNLAELSKFIPKAPVMNPAKAMVDEMIDMIVVATSNWFRDASNLNPTCRLLKDINYINELSDSTYYRYFSRLQLLEQTLAAFFQSFKVHQERIKDGFNIRTSGKQNFASFADWQTSVEFNQCT